MNLRLAGRTALVTGASAGIGRAIALGLASEGVRLAVVARRGELLETLSAEITGGGKRPLPIVQDIMGPEAPCLLREKALAALGRIEILVNSAAASRPLPPDAPDAAWDEAMTLNFTRQREITHALLPQMIAGR